MRYEILTNFFGQHVEVTTATTKTFSGVMRQSEVDSGYNDVVEMEPVDEYKRKHYGSTIIEVDIIKSIKPIKPYDKYSEDEGDYDLKDCCEDAGS